MKLHVNNTFFRPNFPFYFFSGTILAQRAWYPTNARVSRRKQKTEPQSPACFRHNGAGCAPGIEMSAKSATGHRSSTYRRRACQSRRHTECNCLHKKSANAWPTRDSSYSVMRNEMRGTHNRVEWEGPLSHLVHSALRAQNCVCPRSHNPQAQHAVVLVHHLQLGQCARKPTQHAAHTYRTVATQLCKTLLQERTDVRDLLPAAMRQSLRAVHNGSLPTESHRTACCVKGELASCADKNGVPCRQRQQCHLHRDPF